MCDKAILENGGTLKCVLDCYRNQEMCNKAVDNYSPALKFVPECYKTQTMCHKTFDKCFPAFVVFPIDKKFKKCVIESFLMIVF